SSVQPMTDPQDPHRGETGTTPTPAATATAVPEPLAPVMEESQDTDDADTHAILPPNSQTDLGYLAADLGLDLDALSPRFGLHLRTLTWGEACSLKYRLLMLHKKVFSQLSPEEAFALDVYLARCLEALH